MITDAERTRLKNLFSETISLLCRGGLTGASRVDALIGVTLDNQEVVLVNFSENFVYQNEYQTRQEINGEMNSHTQCSQMPQKSNTSGAYSCSVKDECEAGISEDLCNASALVADRGDGSDIIVPNFLSNSHTVEHTELQDVRSSDQVSGIDNLIQESEQTSVLESDSDCLVIKTELPEGDAAVNNIAAESENFIVSSANGISMPSVPSAHKSFCSSSSVRVKYLQNVQRRAQRNPYGSKFYEPRQINRERRTQVSQFRNDASSMQRLDSGAGGLPICPPPSGDGEKRSAAVLDPVQCYMCGAWLRGRQTLTEHIRGKHLSIYNYHCKYCGLSFKWRSALRNHQLNCSVSQNQQ